VNFSDLNGIVGKEVVPDELEILGHGEESQHLSIIVQELLLGSNSSSTKLLFKELEEFFVLLWGNWSLALNE